MTRTLRDAAGRECLIARVKADPDYQAKLAALTDLLRAIEEAREYVPIEVWHRITHAIGRLT